MRREGPVVGAPGFLSGGSAAVGWASCPKACGVCPDQGSSLCPLERQILHLWIAREVSDLVLDCVGGSKVGFTQRHDLILKA